MMNTSEILANLRVNLSEIQAIPKSEDPNKDRNFMQDKTEYNVRICNSIIRLFRHTGSFLMKTKHYHNPSEICWLISGGQSKIKQARCHMINTFYEKEQFLRHPRVQTNPAKAQRCFLMVRDLTAPILNVSIFILFVNFLLK